MKLISSGLFAVLLVISSAVAVSAAEEIETEPIKVTVTRTEQEMQDISLSAGVVTDEDLRREPPVSIADSLERIPGVTVTDGSMAGGKRVSIRNEGGSRVVIMIDGVKLSEQKSMDGPAILMNTNDIERIEVIKGPASVLYGSEAIGGVVNIITKKGGKRPLGFTFETVYDSSTNSFEPRLSVGGNVDGFFYRISGSYVDAGDRDTPQGKIDNTSFIRRNLSAQVGYDWGGGMVYVQGENYDANVSLPGATGIEMDLPRWERYTIKTGAEFRAITDNFVKLKINAYVQNLRKDFMNDITMSPMMSMRLFTQNDQDSFGGNAQTEWIFFTDHYVTAGLDYNRDELRADTNTKISMGGTVISDTDAFQEGSVDTAALYIQDDWSITEKWLLNIGGRATYIRSEMDKAGGNDDVIIDSESDFNVVGAVGLVYDVTENFSLRTHVAQGYRFPSLNQLYIGTSHGSTGYAYGNPELKPETSINYELGARYSSAFNLDAAIYYTDARDYITTQSIPNTADSRFINFDKAVTYGLEIMADYTFESTGLKPYVSLNFTQRETENSGFKTVHNGVPPFESLVGIIWQTDVLRHIFFVDFNHKFAASAKNSYLSGGAVVSDKYDHWNTLNAAVGIKSKTELKYYATVSFRNILNEEYYMARNALMDPGFHVVALVGLEF